MSEKVGGFKTTKVFSSYGPKAEAVWDDIHTLNCEFHCNGNDSLFFWEVGGQDPGGGYIDRPAEEAINKWLIGEGADPNEEVIIEHSW